MERKKLKEIEWQNLLQEYQKNPSLFKRETFIDDSHFLNQLGIFLPPFIENNLVPGYLKMRTEDFIVEEILPDGFLVSVSPNEKNYLDENIPLKNQTVFATLVKYQLSTLEAIEEISSLLNLDRKKIQYGGIKDKDALTAQRISFRGVSSIKTLSQLSSPYFFLKDFSVGKGAMSIGYLKGNRFTILIRTPPSSLEENKFFENLKLIKKNGFFNFFYSQRFGAPRFISWQWGLLILRREYKNAVLSFLCKGGEREIPYFFSLRQEIYQNFGNWEKIEKIIERYPLIFQNELKIIKYLKKRPTDFLGALKQIPEQIQLWIFAYASLLFNKKISQCLQANKPPPDFLPLLLSNDKNDWLEYYDFLKEDKVLTLPYLKPFPFLILKKRLVKTKEKPVELKIKIIPQGIILSFSLGKGCYATTLLAHLFQLISGLPPASIPDDFVDIKEKIGEAPIQKLMEKFNELSHSKKENLFESLNKKSYQSEID